MRNKSRPAQPGPGNLGKLPGWLWWDGDPAGAGAGAGHHTSCEECARGGEGAGDAMEFQISHPWHRRPHMPKQEPDQAPGTAANTPACRDIPCHRDNCKSAYLYAVNKLRLNKLSWQCGSAGCVVLTIIHMCLGNLICACLVIYATAAV